MIDVAKLLIGFEEFSSRYADFEVEALNEKVNFMRQVLAGYLPNTPCTEEGNFKLLQSCKDALKFIVQSKFKGQSYKMFSPIYDKAISNNKNDRKEAYSLLHEIVKG